MTLAAVAQMSSTGVIAENLAVSLSLIKQAATAGAKMIFLPEATDFIAPSSSVSSLLQSKDITEFVEGVQTTAKSSSIWVSVGVHEPIPQDVKRCYNTQLVIDNQGEIQARYRKNHLFDVDIKGGITILESNTTVPGKSMEEPINTPLGKTGLLTCYDIRFPEASLRLRRQGSEIITYPSAFAVKTGAAHWEVLLRSRAIETQSYVMAASQVGPHAGSSRISWGHAMVVDPFGSIIAQCSDMQPYRPTFCLADVDLEWLKETRRSMPLWDQRRYDIYPEL